MLFFLKKIIKKQTNPYFSGDPVVKTFKMVHIKKKKEKKRIFKTQPRTGEQ